MSEAYAVECQNLSKAFPGALALDDVSLRVSAASCHALIGENGAGKSTLGKILAGLLHPDSGVVRLFGKPVAFAGPQDALAEGVAIVHQELCFCENLSIAENLSLDSPPRNGPFIDKTAMKERAEKWLSDVGVNISPDTLVGKLPIGMQQLVQIAGAIGKGARVLIFDEPTSSLTQPECSVLFEKIGELLAADVTCIYVSHRIDEIFALCDTATVLRDGKVVGTQPLSEVDRDAVVQMMIGRAIEKTQYAPADLGPPILEVRDFSSRIFHGVSFDVRVGEILGLAGLIGAGRTEIGEAIFGLDPDVTGDVKICGSQLGSDTSQAMRLGAGLIPEDRKRQGLVLGLSAKENITLPSLSKLSTMGFVRARGEKRLVNEFLQRLRIKAQSIDSPAASLSGGNQQKLLLARWLAADCQLLLLDEPTRGVDVGAKAEIHDIIRELAKSGKAILLISSELPELLSLSTRILVVRSGRIVGEQSHGEATESSLMRLMAAAGAA